MAKRKRSRLFFGMRNFKFETHDIDGNKIDNISEADWKQKIEDEFKQIDTAELAFIFHDRDIEDEGQKKALHVHFVARFANAVDYEPTRHKFGCEKRNFEKARSESSALLYLTHTTSEAIKAKKTRYNVSELKVFVTDDTSKIELNKQEIEDWYRIKIAGKVGNNKTNTDDEVARIIDELAEGTMSLDEVKPELKEIYDSTTATMTWMKQKRYFKEAVAEYYQNKYLEWLEKGRSFKLVYIEGKSGIGKTTFARELAKKINKEKGLKESSIHNAPNDSKGARYDFLNGYDQEAITVFDDLNATTFGYTEFLNLFEKERVAKYSSRFNDKAWFAEVAIITKSSSIDEWTKKLSYSELIEAKSQSDKFNVLYQPRRRFSLIVKLDDEKVTISNYEITDKKTNKHEIKILEELDCSKNGFHDKKFQKMAIEKIAKYLGVIEAEDADLQTISIPEPDVDDVEKLTALLEK